jgi:hypothetical protein
MFEIWALEWNRTGTGWAGWWCFFRVDQRWKADFEASRWPSWQVEIVEVVVR